MSVKICSFFGHRNTVLNDKQCKELKKIIEDLIVNKDVKVFLFGSRSNFDSLCHKIVTELKEKYPFIIRKCYTCQSESCILESEKTYWEELFKRMNNDYLTPLFFEEKVEINNNISFGKASYIERNKAMIKDSNYCIFYYDKDYQPKQRINSKHNIYCYTPNSGTALAYSYAKQQNKKIINFFDRINET